MHVHVSGSVLTVGVMLAVVAVALILTMEGL